MKSNNTAKTQTARIVRVFYDGRKRKVIKRTTLARAKAYIASAAAVGRIGVRIVYVDGYATA